jgi:hypothetical protein
LRQARFRHAADVEEATLGGLGVHDRHVVAGLAQAPAVT